MHEIKVSYLKNNDKIATIKRFSEVSNNSSFKCPKYSLFTKSYFEKRKQEIMPQGYKLIPCMKLRLI